jgi:glycosyltransferase involved in cell wall biosynthesis
LLAWQILQNRFPEWKLRIVGDDAGYHYSTGYLDKMRSLSMQLRLKRIEFTGAMRGYLKWKEYAQAELFVLPTYSENFGMSVAEALASGTPAVVTKGAPWSGLDNYKAGRWIEIGLDPLVGGLEELMRLDRGTLCDMGVRGREWIKVELSWQSIGREMAEVYDWVSGRTDKIPACICMD